jgi:hypothetical protein
MIANKTEQLSNHFYTHIEILPSLILGVMGNLIIFPSNNPVTRNAFSCGQSKQAVSVFHTNYSFVQYNSFCDIVKNPLTLISHIINPTRLPELQLKGGGIRRRTILLRNPIVNYIVDFISPEVKEHFEIFGKKLENPNKVDFYETTDLKHNKTKISPPKDFMNNLDFSPSEFSEYSIFTINNSHFLCLTKHFYSPQSVEMVYLFDITDTLKVKFYRYVLMEDEPWKCGMADFNHDGFLEIFINDLYNIKCYSILPQGVMHLKEYYINKTYSNSIGSFIDLKNSHWFIPLKK